MFEFIKKVLVPQNDNFAKHDENLFKLQASVCLLLVDIAKADGSFSTEEKEKIYSIMISEFDADENLVGELIDRAEQVLKQDDAIYDYTQVINKSLDNDEKYELLKNFWRLVYINKSKDIYEEHLVKEIGGLIDMDYRDVVAAKLSIKDELNI